MLNSLALIAASLKPSLPVALAGAVSRTYAYVVATLASLMRPQAESPAEAAARLRTLADHFGDTHPSHAADLRAAADRAHG